MVDNEREDEGGGGRTETGDRDISGISQEDVYTFAWSFPPSAGNQWPLCALSLQ